MAKKTTTKEKPCTRQELIEALQFTEEEEDAHFDVNGNKLSEPDRDLSVLRRDTGFGRAMRSLYHGSFAKYIPNTSNAETTDILRERLSR